MNSHREGSKALELEWISMETEIMKNFVSIDCVSESKLCKENDVISYPAIRLFRKNKSVARYRGPRKAIL
jgi:protein disulfide-isomerase A1